MCARMVSMCSSHTACRLSRASVLWQACAKLGRRVVGYASDFQLDFLMWASCSTVPACTARGELGACPSNPRTRLCCRCLVGDAPLATAQVSSHTDRVARIESGGSRRTDPVGRNGVERTKERGGEERDYPKGPGNTPLRPSGPPWRSAAQVRRLKSVNAVYEPSPVTRNPPLSSFPLLFFFFSLPPLRKKRQVRRLKSVNDVYKPSPVTRNPPLSSFPLLFFFFSLPTPRKKRPLGCAAFNGFWGGVFCKNPFLLEGGFSK